MAGWLVRAISLCDRRRTCTARRGRGVVLALATPTIADERQNKPRGANRQWTIKRVRKELRY